MGHHQTTNPNQAIRTSSWETEPGSLSQLLGVSGFLCFLALSKEGRLSAHFRTLGLSDTASAEAVRKAYRSLASRPLAFEGQRHLLVALDASVVQWHPFSFFFWGGVAALIKMGYPKKGSLVFPGSLIN